MRKESFTYPLLYKDGWLSEQYTIEKRTLQDIASQVGCSWATVQNALKNLMIPRRNYTVTARAIRVRKLAGSNSGKKRRKHETD